MSVIPSIILSAVLSCSGNSVNIGQVINTINNNIHTEVSNSAEAVKIVDELKNIGVKFNTSEDSIKKMLEGILNSEDNKKPAVTAKPTAAPTEAPAVTAKPTAAPTKAPVVTAKPTAAPTKTPVATAKPTAAPTQSGTNSAYVNEVVRLVNQQRAANGLKSLTLDTTLTSAAQKRAVETAASFSHTRPNGTKFSTVLSEYGISYRYSGENIAYGQSSPQEVVNAWMNSSGHRANIVSANYNKIGVGCYKKGSTYYWSQLFTN